MRTRATCKSDACIEQSQFLFEVIQLGYGVVCWDSGKRSKATKQPHHTVTECGTLPKTLSALRLY